MKKASWRTTLGGILIALGSVLASPAISKVISPQIQEVGTMLQVGGAILIGKSAVDTEAVHDSAKKDKEE